VKLQAGLAAADDVHAVKVNEPLAGTVRVRKKTTLGMASRQVTTLPSKVFGL
jgi:hypothetical protein